MKTVVKYLSRKCIGYDFKRNLTFYEERVVFGDNSTGTIYSTYIDWNGRDQRISETEHKPHIRNPL